MKTKLPLTLLFWCVPLLMLFAQSPVRIACVGNSITYGTSIVNREKNSFPAQLQAMLGVNYVVGNFGQGGATMLKKGNNPYWQREGYKLALASNPNIVFIMLGTNDSKAMNRPFYNEFDADYKEMVSSFEALPTKPRVILVVPPPSFLADSNSIYDPVILNKIKPMIQKVAFDKSLEIIDLHPLFDGEQSLFPDQIHPSSLGATVIAKRFYEAVKLVPANEKDVFASIGADKKVTSFHGFEMADFMLDGHACKVVKPKVAAKGQPWVWRARFFGHQPQADIALLERGFHIAYCDVAELFGNNEAVSVWDKFYQLMVSAGLGKKVALEGMSRGGVYMYNWALTNPKKVACVYADAPVLDLRSWPGGKGKSKGSKADWEIFKKDYHLTEEQAMAYDQMPVDNAAKIAKLGFPMLHVVGDADVVVPIAENTTPFEERVKAAGGDLKVIHKPGVDHHPHSLANPTPIVDFILTATGHKTNFANIAVPSGEYRSGAGWGNGKDWWSQKDNIDSLLGATTELDVLFVGNSITQGMGGHRTQLAYKPGFAVFEKEFGNRQWECAGIAGDKTENVLYRLQNGNYAKANPKLVVLTIGVNNFKYNGAPEIAQGIHSIAKWISQNMAQTKLLLIGPLPTGIAKNSEQRTKYDAVQSLLVNTKFSKNVFYRPMDKAFILPNGDLDTAKYSGDGIHLTTKGYEAWAQALKPIVDQILK